MQLEIHRWPSRNFKLGTLPDPPLNKMRWGPCRPTQWAVASVLDKWNGDESRLGRIIATKDIRVIPGSQAANGLARLELTHRLAMIDRRVFGIIIEIRESDKMLNTPTAYRFEVLVQLVYPEGAAKGPESWMWCKVVAFSSNLLLTEPGVVLLGTVVTGVLAPTFGAHMAALLESWAISSGDEWHFYGPGEAPRPMNFDLDHGTADGLPVSAGSGFDLQRLRYAISGVRLRPPTLGPHVFHREFASSSGQPANAEGEKAETDPREIDGVDMRKTTKQLYAQTQTEEKRDESILARARRAHSRRRQSTRRGRGPRRRVSYTEIGKKNLQK